MADNGREHFKTSIDTSQFQRDAKKIQDTFRQIGDKAESEGMRMDAVFNKLGRKALGIFGGITLTGFVKDIVRVRSEFQNTEAMFKVFLGNAEKASGFMKELQKYAFHNVFDFSDLTQQAAQLLAYGNSAEKTIGILDKLSNVAAGVNKPLERFVELYNKAKSRNKLDQNDIQQWSVMGDVVSYLADMMGKSTTEIQKMVSEGKIGFNEMDQLLTNLTSSGGMFYGMMEEKMKTLGDSIGQLQDNLTAMYNEIGEKSQDYLRTGILAVNELVENYEKVGRTIVELIALYGTYKAAVITLTAVEKLRYQATLAHMAGLTKMQAILEVLRVKNEALKASMAANPYVVVGAAIAALGFGMYKVITHQTEMQKAQKRLNESFMEAEKNAFGETRELAKLKGELQAAKKGTEEYNTIKNKIIANYGKYYKGLEDEIEKVGLLDSTYRKLTESIQQSFAVRQYEKFKQEQTDNLDETLSKQLGKIQDRLLKDLGDEVGTQIYTSIRNSLLNGEQLTDEAYQIIQKVQDKGTFYADSRIDDSIRKIREAQAVADRIDKKARIKFGVDEAPKKKDDGEDNGDKTVFSDINQEVKATTENVAKLKREIQDLRSGKTPSKDYAKDLEDKTKELKTAEDKLKSLTGKDYSEKGLNTAQQEAQRRLDAEQWLAEKYKQLDNDKIQQQLDFQRQEIELMDDSFRKKEQLAENEYRQQLHSIKVQGDTMVKAQQEIQKKQWEAAGKKGVFTPTITTIEQLPKDQQGTLAKMREQAADQLTKQEKDLSKELAEMRQEETLRFASNLDRQLAEIDHYYTERIRQAEDNEELIALLRQNKETETNQAYIDSRLEMIEFDTGITLRRMELAKKFYLFEADKTKEQLQVQKKAAEETLDLLKEKFKQAPTDELAKEINEVTVAIEEMAAAIEEIPFSKFQKTLAYISQISGGIKELFDGSNFGTEIGWIADFADGTGSLAAGIATMNPAQMIDGVFKVANTVKDIINTNRQANKEIREFYYNLEQSALQYSISLINALKDIASGKDSIFFTDKANQLTQGMNGYEQSLQKQKELTAQLGDVTVKTGVKKKKFLGITTGTKDVYENLLKKYPDLIKANGDLNEELAESLLNSGNLSKEASDLINNILDATQAAEAAIQQVESVLSDLAGEVGNKLRDSLVEAFRDGTDAAQTFKQSVSSIMEDIITDFLFAEHFGDLLSDLENRMKESYSSDGDKDLIDDLLWFADAWQSGQEELNQDLNKIKQQMKEKGYNLFEESEATATAKGFATASQDSINELNGYAALGISFMRVNTENTTEIMEQTIDIHSNIININENVRQLATNSQTILSHLSGIHDNTKRLEAIETNIRDVNHTLGDIQLHGIRIK